MSTFVFAPSWMSYPNKPKRTDDFPNLQRDSQNTKDISSTATAAASKKEHYPPLITKSTQSSINNSSVWSNPKLIRKIHSPTDSDDEAAEEAVTTARYELERLKALVPKTSKKKSNTKKALSVPSSSTTLPTLPSQLKPKQTKQKIFTNTVHIDKTPTAIDHADIHPTSTSSSSSLRNKKRLSRTQSSSIAKETGKKDVTIQRQSYYHHHHHQNENPRRLQPRASSIFNALKSNEPIVKEDNVALDTKDRQKEKVESKRTTDEAKAKPARALSTQEVETSLNCQKDVISKEEQQNFMYFIKSWTSYGTCTSPLQDEEEEDRRYGNQQPFKTYYSYFHCSDVNNNDEHQSKSSNGSVSSSSNSSHHAITTPQQAKFNMELSLLLSQVVDDSITDSYFYYNPFHK